MKNMLLTTALVSLIAAMPVSAQTADGTFMPPEGYTQFESSTLTIENLQGATVYDANGDSVGSISDFIFAGGGATGSATANTGMNTTSSDTSVSTDTGTTGATTGATDGTVMTDGTGTTTTTETDAGTMDGTTSGSVTGDATTTADPSTDMTSTDTTTSTDSTTGMAADDTAQTGTGLGNATGTTAGTGTDTDLADTDATDRAVTDTDMAGSDLGADPDMDLTTDLDAERTDMTAPAGTDMAATERQQEVDVTSGQISHVVLDVGGFLGIGTHTVAVPLEELQVFRDEGNNIRVYLPWTQAQLEALPEFDENDPATLDAVQQAPAPSGG